jgi:hypothetical protein
MRIPFHKQLDKDKQAGQIVFSPPVPNTQPELYLSDSHKQETTLAQYIERKTDEPKRITVDEGLAELYVKHWGWEAPYDVKDADDYDMHVLIWNTALTKGKL